MLVSTRAGLGSDSIEDTKLPARLTQVAGRLLERPVATQSPGTAMWSLITAVFVGVLRGAGVRAVQDVTANSDTRFEVASVRPTRDIASGAWSASPGRFVRQNVRLKALISYGFGIDEYRIVGGTSMMERRYDVEATTPTGSTPDDLRAMVRNLLADRFSLRVHEELRRMPVYYLTVAGTDRSFGPQ